jgi:hypothetical protein
MILNIYAANHRVSKYRKQKMRTLKEEIDK